MRCCGIVAAAAMAVACAGAAAAAVPRMTGTLFAADKREPGRRDGGSVQKIDLASGREVGRAKTCENPHEMAPSPDGRYIAVACFSGSQIEIYRTDRMTRVKSFELGAGALPHGVVWRKPGRIVATAQGRGTIFAIDDPLGDSPRLREIGEPIKDGPHMVVVSEDGKTAWGAANFASVVIAYDLESGKELRRAQLSGFTEGIRLTAGDKGLFLAAARTAKLFRLDPRTLKVVAEIPVGRSPVRVTSDTTGRYVATSNREDGTISVVDIATNRPVRTIRVSGDAEPFQIGIAFSSDGRRIYVTEIEANDVVEVDFSTGKILRRFKSPAGPDGLAISD